MRHSASIVAGAALLASVAAAGASAQPADASTPRCPLPCSLNLTPGQEGRVAIKGGAPGTPGRMWGYWGKFTGMETGSYRATCVWLADMSWGPGVMRDSRLLCTIVLSFRARSGGVNEPNGGGLVMEGLVRKPPGKDGLFEHPSDRQLAITGATGPYKGMWGHANLRAAPTNILIRLYE
jgi:hypothetical protein